MKEFIRLCLPFDIILGAKKLQFVVVVRNMSNCEG